MGRHHLQNDWLVILSIIIRLSLGCLFFWSSLPKILLPHSFLGDVYAYRLVGPSLGMIVAMVLPWMELIAGICLLGGLFVSGALLACMGMALLFVGPVSWALYHGLNISCGCFGSGASVHIGYGTLIRIAVIFLGSGFAYLVEILSQKHIRTSPHSEQAEKVSLHKEVVANTSPKPFISGLEAGA
jgi:hypothetical protein